MKRQRFSILYSLAAIWLIQFIQGGHAAESTSRAEELTSRVRNWFWSKPPPPQAVAEFDIYRKYAPDDTFIWNADDPLINAKKIKQTDEQALQANLDCLPYRTNLTPDVARAHIKSIASAKVIDSIFNFCNKFPKTGTDHLNALYFNIYKNGRFSANIHGPHFKANAHLYIDLDQPILIMMGGVCTDCGMEYFKVATIYDWRTHMAYALNENGAFKQALSINWGDLACENYFCIIKYLVESVGEELAKIINDLKIASLVTLAVQSIAGHIGAIICRKVKGKIANYIGLDIAGPCIGPRTVHPLNWMSKLPFYISKGMADRTYIIYTDHAYGSKILGRAHVNIFVRPKGDKLPGRNGAKHLYEHAFASFFATGMASKVFYQGLEVSLDEIKNEKLTGQTHKTHWLNVFYDGDEIPEGNYLVIVDKCWPFGGRADPGTPAAIAMQRSLEIIAKHSVAPAIVAAGIATGAFAIGIDPRIAEGITSRIDPVNESIRQELLKTNAHKGAAPAMVVAGLTLSAPTSTNLTGSTNAPSHSASTSSTAGNDGPAEG